MFSTVAKFSLFTFLYFYSVSLQTRLGAIANLKPELNEHKQDPRLLREVGDLRAAILTHQVGLL
ncbi:MAG: hypothetical protein V7K96_09575 [Nostoc sp.]